ncbi:3-methyl-2-oxobutanoate hydroxymethyltransferase [Nocardiopsis salina]|uniref:3-methyl-2-oxobutanoate hydroxymethyltransferase n=1 Tax=Nocardiopsis salina TaxID=245836 RepID=UPI000348DC70|nr:3-methyl-2-oxobutanoate hydroxymethyltransferase [Nocardiopsis salina]
MNTTSQAPSRGTALYGGVTNRRVTVRDLASAKGHGERWPMLTSYDAMSARIFDESGIPVLLVGDSAANVVYGYDTTVPVSVDELLPLVAGVARSTQRAMVVADLPFGSYEGSPQQALETATRFMKEGRAQAVKLEGGTEVAPQVELLVRAGVPVMAHVGLTPQSVNTLGGFRVQGRGEAADQLLEDARSMERAGAFAVVLEAVPADLGARVTEELGVPTVGIGAGASTDAQVLVWQDMAGLSDWTPKFVKTFTDLRASLRDAAETYAEEVREGSFPEDQHSYSG